MEASTDNGDSVATFTKPGAVLHHVWLRTLSDAIASPLWPPRVDVELYRHREVHKLRAFYERRIRELTLGDHPPRESFNRWLFERINRRIDGQVLPIWVDPLLGCIESDSVRDGSQGLREVLLDALPVELPYATWDDADAQRRNLRLYAEAAMLLLVREEGDSATYQMCSEALSWTATNDCPEMETAAKAAEMLARLRAACEIVVEKHHGPAIERLCEDLEVAAREASASVRIFLEQSKSQSSRSNVEVSVTFDARRGSYFLAVKMPQDATLEQQQGDDNSDASGDDLCAEQFAVGIDCFGRLCKALNRTIRDAKEESKVQKSPAAVAVTTVVELLTLPNSPWELIFCLLCRYDALCGPGRKEGGGFHAALPSAVFDALDSSSNGDGGNVDDKGGGGQRLECFASPLLCRRGSWRYCSLFDDLDVLFGSLGSFFHERLQPELLRSGTLVLNPPFIAKLVDKLAQKMLTTLDRCKSSGTSLRFFLIFPWRSAAVSSAQNSGIEAHAEDRWPIPAVLGDLLSSSYVRGSLRRRRRSFVYGLAFKTDHVWPQFEVQSRLVLLESLPRDRKSVTQLLRCVRKAWSGKGVTGAGDRASDSSSYSDDLEFPNVGPLQALGEVNGKDLVIGRAAKLGRSRSRSRSIQTVR
eukprot:TRINITY_DN60970_c0_g1_i1.p1 TRINITY_DN60970_c0_g1~~TRINITY_DN60970_c0_g1_i1.p1  ORF type:complete len:655 (-),score=94.93 TRINITY_DN60970_c0_g1_i1:60-1988(-)